MLTQTVEQNTATTMTSSVNPSIHGTPVTFTAVVVATGTTVPDGDGDVLRRDDADRHGNADGGGHDHCGGDLPDLDAGGGQRIRSPRPTAAMRDDFSSTSAALAQTVNIASSTTALAASANPAIAGKALTLTATVTTNGGTAAGTVNFYNGTTLLGTGTLNGVGVATLDDLDPAGGKLLDHRWLPG